MFAAMAFPTVTIGTTMPAPRAIVYVTMGTTPIM